MGRICYPPKRHTFNFVCFANIQKRMEKGYVEIKKMRFPGVKDAKRPFQGLFILPKNAIFSLCIFIRFEMALQKFNFWRAKVALLERKSGTFGNPKLTY